jgi:acyl dehydratase
LDPTAAGEVAAQLTDSTGSVTTSGVSRFGPPLPVAAANPEVIGSATFKGLATGMRAGRTREFHDQDVADFLALTRDPNPLFAKHQEVPPGLLAGITSCVLGIDLPGRGTNWLKQRYTFHRPVPIPAAVTSTVTITRIRPEKGLINLATSTTTADRLAVSGEALVLAIDIAERH